MRKYSLTLLVLLLVFALGLGAVACGSDTSATKDMTPQEMLTAAMDASKTVTSQSGTYEVDITIDADTGQMSADDQAMAQAFLGQPIKLTGTFASQNSPALADLTVAFGLMGANIGAGVRVIDDKGWVNVLGQWYEAPADMMEQVGGTENAAMAETLQQIMDEADIDPNTWFKDLKAVGTETLLDTEVTHLTGNVDVTKMVADVVALMQNPKFAELLAAGSATAGAQTGVELPTAADLAEVQSTLEQMLKSATLDLWIANSDSSLRKTAMSADIAIPAEMATSGSRRCPGGSHHQPRRPRQGDRREGSGRCQALRATWRPTCRATRSSRACWVA